MMPSFNMIHLKATLFASIVFVFTFPIYASELIKVKLWDGRTVTGKLDLPTGKTKISKIVVFVHGTGPGTYLDHRIVASDDFNYFDYFSKEFNRRGIAFFVANKRGVEIGDDPPFFDRVDRDEFRKVVPLNSAKDIASSIETLRKDKRLRKAEFILLGWSEGTVISTLVAEEKRNRIAGLLLAGYVHENMIEIIRWQNEGEASMIVIQRYFDKNSDDKISKVEFETDDGITGPARSQILRNATFEQMDKNHDNFIDKSDFKVILEPLYKSLLNKWKARDEEWIWGNYFRVSLNWLDAHADLEANKERMLRLKMPIYIFQGENDANCGIKGVYDIESRFARAKKNNLRAFIFKEHDHSLNFMSWVRAKTIPDGINKIFEVAEGM